MPQAGVRILNVHPPIKPLHPTAGNAHQFEFRLSSPLWIS